MYESITYSQILTVPTTVSTPPTWIFPSSSVDLDFANNRYWNGTGYPNTVSEFLVCSRSSTGTAINATGTVESFASNVLRRTSAGLLIEESRTNLQLQSQGQFNNTTYWTNAGTTRISSIVDNALVAPDGTTTASTFTEGSANNAHSEFPTSPIGATVSGSAYTASVFAKMGTQRYFCLTLSPDNGSDNHVAQVFDLQAGVLGEHHVGSISGIFDNANIIALANGWYYCSVTGSALITNQSISFAGSNTLTGNTWATSGQPMYTGTGLTWSIWGAQMELGSFGTSYIPTTTSSVTRAADNITSTGAGNAGLVDTTWRGSAGSIIYYTKPISGTTNGVFIADNSNEAYLNASESVGGDVHITRSSSTPATRTTNLMTGNFLLQKIGGSWDGAAESIVLNRGTLVTGAQIAGGALTSPTQIGANPSLTSILNGNLTRLALWNSKIADATLRSFT